VKKYENIDEFQKTVKKNEFKTFLEKDALTLFRKNRRKDDDNEKLLKEIDEIKKRCQKSENEITGLRM
jgi:hypothetical protein